MRSDRSFIITGLFRNAYFSPPHVTKNLIAALTGPLFLDTHFFDA